MPEPSERDRALYQRFLLKVGFADDPDASAWASHHEDDFLDLITAAREGWRHPRPITDEMVEAFCEKYFAGWPFQTRNLSLWREDIRAALEAAEAARTKE